MVSTIRKKVIFLKSQKPFYIPNSFSLTVIIMADGKKRNLRRRLAWNDEGALEGLPLYMIILVTITALALILIIAMIPRGPFIDNIVVDPQGGSGYTDRDTTFEGTVYDTKGNPLGGVDILAEGPNNAVGTTASADETGRFTISLNKEPTLSQNQNTGTITFTATYKGTSVQTTVTIING
jgi:hypothetical protein